MNEQDSIIREINDVMSDLLNYHFKGEKALPTDLIKQYERLIEADKLMKDYEYPEKIDKIMIFGTNIQCTKTIFYFFAASEKGYDSSY